MLANEYFLNGIKSGLYTKKSWIISLFSIVLSDSKPSVERVYYKPDGVYYFDPETEAYILIAGSSGDRPLLDFNSKLELKSGDLPNVKSDITTTIGQCLVNVFALVFPFGDKIDYINGEFDLDKVESIIADRLTTDPEYQTDKDTIHEDPIYVDEYLTFTNTITALEGFSQLCVPSASPKSLTTDPRIPIVREELLEKHKDELDDPVVVAKIEKILTDMDREWIKGDVSEGFFIKDKHFKETRKKMHVIYGAQKAFGSDPELIGTSLSEGWDTDKLPGMINSLREGSYARGKGTGLGGYAVNIINAMLQNVAITEDNCGSKLGWKRLVTQEAKEDFIGYYRVLKSGNSELITDKNITSLHGSEVVMRTPQFCKTGKPKYCKECMGVPNSEYEKALTSYAAAIASTLMAQEMKKMHVSNLQTTTYDIGSVFS